MLKWLESYLTGKSQFVIHEGVKSDIYNVTCGAPQSSILAHYYLSSTRMTSATFLNTYCVYLLFTYLFALYLKCTYACLFVWI